jgi:hypothetical protein
MGFILADQAESCVFHLVVGSPDRCEKPNRCKKPMTVAAASDSTSNRKSAAIIPVNSVIHTIVAFAPRVAVPLTFTLAALAFALVAPGIALGFTVTGRTHLRIGRTVKMNNGEGGINDRNAQTEFGKRCAAPDQLIGSSFHNFIVTHVRILLQLKKH